MSSAVLDWGVATRPLPGEMLSGDAHLVVPFPGGALMAAVDGLGHGPAAEAAARAAIEVLRQAPHRPVAELVAACDEALKRLRGVVMSLASFDVARSQMTWLGVGNVESIHFRKQGMGFVRERLFVRGGIVGQSLGTLRPATVSVAPDDVFVLATDGLDSRFVDATLIESVQRGEGVERMAQQLLERHAQARDDALVLVARYLGGTG
jgi:serine phosphatase RsbU (regulator of sigma subunit)